MLLMDTGISIAAVDDARASRIRLGPDLCHINDDIPALDLLPEPEAIRRMHQDLAQGVEPKASAAEPKEKSFARRAVSLLDLADAIRFANDLEALASAHLMVADEPWLDPIFPLRKHDGGPRAESAALVEFARDATSQLSRRAAFLLRPVDVPVEALTDQTVFDVVARLSAGEKVFTAFAAREKRQKPVITAMTIAGVAPAGLDDWQHIRDYLAWRRDIQALNARWRALAVELGAPALSADYPQTIYGFEKIVRSINVAIVTAAVAERNINSVAGSKLLMSRADIDLLLADVGELQKFGAAVRFAVTEREASRLELTRLKEMFAGEGAIPASVRDEVLARIGQADVDQVCESWTRLRGQIARLHDRREDFDRVRAVGKALADAGAPIFARRVKTEVAQPGSVDQVFTGDWAAAWNWAALSRQLKEMGEEQHLRQLATRREQLEKTLRDQFQAVVTARTDFAAAQGLNSTARRALAIFMIAIRKMASATDGLAAHHHRRVAREALDGCCEGIPCWIMPGWRVAERLPAKLRAFDLVIMDEASGSNVSEIATLLRGRKILVIGDDKQVEPPSLQINHSQLEGHGDVFLRALPRTIRPFVLPGSSLYDLAKVMFPGNQIHLRDDAQVYRDPIGATPHFAESGAIAGSANGAQLDQAIELAPMHDAPETPRAPVLSEADVLADEISKVVALLPNINRLKPRDAVLLPADRKPAPPDAVLNEAPPIADRAKVDWPPSERSPEANVKISVLTPLREDRRSRGFGSQPQLPEVGSPDAGAPPWLLRPRFSDDAPRPATGRVDETPAEGEVRATGPELSVVPQPRVADARRSVKGRVAIAAVVPLMLLVAGAYLAVGAGRERQARSEHGELESRPVLATGARRERRPARAER